VRQVPLVVRNAEDSPGEGGGTPKPVKNGHD
jgi:hypothetical protein